MKTLIKNVIIVDKNSDWNNKKVDVLIENEYIISISENSIEEKDVSIYNAEGKYITNGFTDLIGSIPAEEDNYKETIETAQKAAQKGGFTSVALLPIKNQSLQTKEQLRYLKSYNLNSSTQIFPIASLTKDLNGKEMTEMYDLHKNGAKFFSEDREYIKNSNVMKTSLEYSKIFNGKIMSFPYDTSVNEGAFINESDTSVYMGLKGSPNFSEVLGVQRELTLAKYTNAPIHLACISTAESVDLIREAKKNGVNVTASVAVHNIYFQDSDLVNFNPNLKVIPPIRSKEDKDALVSGLKDGTIDCVVSNHHPQDKDAKFCEFSNASFGALSYQSALAASYEVLKSDTDINTFVELFNKKPLKLLSINNTINEGEIANLSLFSLDNDYVFNETDIVSLSKNSPYIGEKFQFKIEGTYNNGKWQIN